MQREARLEGFSSGVRAQSRFRFVQASTHTAQLVSTRVRYYAGTCAHLAWPWASAQQSTRVHRTHSPVSTAHAPCRFRPVMLTPHRIASWQQIPRANPRARLHAQSFHPERMCLEYCSSLSCGLSHATAREAPTAFAAPPCPAKHSLVAFALPAPRRHLIRPCARTYPQRIISTMPSSSAALRSAWTSSRIQRLAFRG